MKSQSFFGGDRVENGRVRKLTVTTWPDLVKELLGHPALVNLTREQFLAMPKRERDEFKRVAYLTPACFRSADGPRVYEQATVCNLIALDVDDPRDAAPLVNSPQRLVEALAPHPFAAYVTASSTPTAPRLRVFVNADNIPIDNYPDAVRYVASRLGLVSITRESLVAVQPMFLPTIFAGEDPLITHPLIVAVEDGTPVTEADKPASDSMEAAPPAPVQR